MIEWGRPWQISLAAHALVAAVAFALVWRPGGGTEVIPFDLKEVYQSPAPTLQARNLIQPKPKEAVRPRQVFGLNRNALTAAPDDAGALDVKAGNTSAKAPDAEKLTDADANALPIPADEYLVTEMPRIVEEIRVPYPESARKKRVQGAVLFDLLIDASGTVREARLIDGPGEGLNEAAQSAVERLRFAPAKVQDRPVAVRIRYAYRFVLEN